MKVQKIKALNRHIEQCLKNPPNIPRNSYSESLQQCSLCIEVRRQNYQLKQQILNLQDTNDQNQSLKRQLEALKELYQLKCEENQIIQKKLITITKQHKQNKEQYLKFQQQNYQQIKQILYDCYHQ